MKKNNTLGFSSNLFGTLCANMRKVDYQNLPKQSFVCMGFTDQQIKFLKVKHPKLIWYDAEKQMFFDQGDSTKIRKTEYLKINKSNYNASNPMKNLAYYIMIDGQTIEESNHPD